MKISIKKEDLRKNRVVWGFNPHSRVVSSKKKYNRKKMKNELKKEII